MITSWNDPIASLRRAQTEEAAAAPPPVVEGALQGLAKTGSEDGAASKTPGEVQQAEQAGVTGLEEVEFGAGRISVDDKQMINCRADLNQLVPFKYQWAWQKYLDACANHWMPQEVNMTADIALWKSADGLTEDERIIIKRNLGFFASAGPILVAGDKAHGTWYQQEELHGKDGGKRFVVGRYEDDYVKVDGRWYFQKRVYEVLKSEETG